MTHPTTVFLSSTASDLADCREAAYQAIEGLDGFHCVRMEDFGSHDSNALELVERKVRECDVVVCLLGWSYGSRPDRNNLSYTEIEYNAAARSRKPRLVFLASPSLRPAQSPISPDDSERQNAFRSRVLRERVVVEFQCATDVPGQVRQAIQNWQRATNFARRRRRRMLMFALAALAVLAVVLALAVANWSSNRTFSDEEFADFERRFMAAAPNLGDVLVRTTHPNGTLLATKTPFVTLSRDRRRIDITVVTTWEYQVGKLVGQQIPIDTTFEIQVDKAGLRDFRVQQDQSPFPIQEANRDEARRKVQSFLDSLP